MKLVHIILLSSAGAATTARGAGAFAESVVSLGPHFAEAVDEALETGHYGSNMQRLIMCRDGHHTSKTCYDFVMSMLINGTNAVRYVTRECGTICREFPDYHCLDNCKRVQLGETYDGEFAYAMHLLRKMLGMRKMTMLERWGHGFLHFPFKLLTAGGGVLGGALLSAIMSGGLYHMRQKVSAPGGAAPAAPQPMNAVLLVGCLFFAFLGSIFLGSASQKLFAYVNSDGEL